MSAALLPLALLLLACPRPAAAGFVIDFESPARDENRNPIGSGPFDVTFRGTLSGGGTVSQTFTVDSFLTLKTFHFSGFTGVVEVRWFQGGGPPDAPPHQFDNVTLAEPTVVPAPPGIVLLGSGLALLAAHALRARRGRARPCA